MGNDVVRLRRDPLAKQTHAERLTLAALKHEIDAAVDFYVVIEELTHEEALLFEGHSRAHFQHADAAVP